MSEKKLTPKERMAIWQELLSQPEGTTRDAFMHACAKESGLHYSDFDDTSRQDIVIIKKLLASTDVFLKESGQKKKRFVLSAPIDLVSLYSMDKVMKPYKDLFRLLEKMDGFLPQSFLEDASSAYRKIKENQTSASVISFQTDYKEWDSLRFFSDIFKAINKYGVVVERQIMQSSSKTVRVTLYPEYLKQYKSEWYVFGTVINEDGNREAEGCSRIPMSMIESVTPMKTSSPFISSGTDYEEYFAEIIGVENDPNCEEETVKLRVSKKIHDRIWKYPIHDTQRRCPDISTSSYEGISITVRRNKELIRTLLDYGKDIEVVAPAKLRKQIKKELERTLDMYK